MIVDPEERSARILNNHNMYITDPARHFHIGPNNSIERDMPTEQNTWTIDECEIFIRTYLLAPKQFYRIAQELPHKTVEQCVLWYYRNKKMVNFK
ncbi:hypothetical protein GQ42DRAFT_113929, partial [Ramicandelaber brevisporus]